VNLVEPSRSEAPLDLVVADARANELLARNHAMLARSERGNRPFRRSSE
jgi:hypothetical protein